MKINLLIDGKNMLYRAIFAAKSDSYFSKNNYHSSKIIFHFLHHYYKKFNPNSIHIFWDSKRERIWRRDILPTYKEQRNSNSKFTDVSEELQNLMIVCMELFNNCNFRQYARPRMEADDLIYAFCKFNRADSENIIVSSDGDLKQIPFSFRNVKVHNPLSKEKKDFEDIPELDPVLIKSFSGDKSDNINGYYRVGPVISENLCRDPYYLQTFLNSEKHAIIKEEDKKFVGDERLRDNFKIIDLSLCPYLIDNMLYVVDRQATPLEFNIKKIKNIIIKRKLKGLMEDLSSYIIPFKELKEEVENGS